MYLVYFYYYREDDNSLTITEKNWIEENITTLVDIEVISDYPIYGDQDGVFASFIKAIFSVFADNFLFYRNICRLHRWH